MPVDQLAKIRSIDSVEELEGYRWGLRVMESQPSQEETLELAKVEKYLRNKEK